MKKIKKNRWNVDQVIEVKKTLAIQHLFVLCGKDKEKFRRVLDAYLKTKTIFEMAKFIENMN